MAFVGVLCLAGVAHAGEVRLLIPNSKEAYVGMPFTVAIEVVSKDSHDPPAFPNLANADVTAAGQNTSSSSSFQIRLGGKPISTKKTTTQYRYQITPRKPGIVKIPRIVVRVDGQKLRTQPAKFRVTKSETGDLMYLELVGSKKSIYVGEPIELTLEIWLRPFSQGKEALDQNNMWQTISHQTSDWGPFLELVQQRRPQVTVRRDRRKGLNGATHSYFVYELKKQVWPDRSGPIDVGDVRIVATYPLRVRRDRGFFGAGLKIAQSKPIVATISKTSVRVKPIPTEGRPPYYRGAVGPHSVKVSANPKKVRVGDPITLNIAICGNGRLESLRAPALADLHEFTSRFQVSDDPLPGTIERKCKRFTQSIRALDDDVSEIPAIPYAYFDAKREKFVTVRSSPISIQVAPAERMSATQIVESGTAPSRATRSLTTLDQGIESNYGDPNELLAHQGFYPSTMSAVLAVGSPLLYLICVVVGRRRRKLTSNVALVRRHCARKIAMQRTRKAIAGNASPQAASDLMGALLGYVADRLDLPTGGLTREEAVAGLRETGATKAMVERANAVLFECETAQFGGGSTTLANTLASRVTDCIDELEHQRL